MPTACHTLCDASRHAMRPFFGVKLLFDQVSRRLELGFGVIAEFGVVPPLEVPHKGVNDLQPGHLSLRFERVNPLISTCRALIDELFATDPHHFHHLVRIDVIGHRGVMQYDAGGEPDRKSTRLNSSHVATSYAVFCLKTKTSNRSERRR